IGYSRDEAIGKRLEEMFAAPDEAAAVDQHRRLVLAAQGTVTGAEEVVRLRRDGRPIMLSVVTCVLRDENGRPDGVATVGRDVTEARRRDKELRQKTSELTVQNRRMRELAGRLVEIREQERTRISREIHDELGQLLTGLKMDLNWISRRLADPRQEEAIGAKI